MTQLITRIKKVGFTIRVSFTLENGLTQLLVHQTQPHLILSSWARILAPISLLKVALCACLKPETLKGVC
jgi:hypothetical protein